MGMLNSVLQRGFRAAFVILAALFAVTALSMLAIGFQLGSGRRSSPQVALALALAFAVVILLIADLDRSHEGFLTVDQTPMTELAIQVRAAEEKARQ